MIIHVVESGETLYSISTKYNTTIHMLIKANGLSRPDNLAVGQALIIAIPNVVHTIKEGDTWESIEEEYNTSIMELLRNNPDLSNRYNIYPGETIVISYETEKTSTFAISGYAYPYINKDILKKTLPFLTYLTVFNYQVTGEGDIIDITNQEVIQLAKDYGVAPMMFFSTISAKGEGSISNAFELVNNPESQERAISNTLRILEDEGYYGVNIYLQYLSLENRQKVDEFITRAADIFHSAGYRVILTISPRVILEENELRFEEIDYSSFARVADGILFLNYEGGITFGAPGTVAPVNILREMLDYVTDTVPPEKIFIGLPTTGYDWELPYVPGVTWGNAITTDAAVQIAFDEGVPIFFNQEAKAPYFYYEREELHLVWFKDARSFEAIGALVPEYGLQGLSIWNIMNFNTQLWFVINLNYNIEKVGDGEFS